MPAKVNSLSIFLEGDTPAEVDKLATATVQTVNGNLPIVAAEYTFDVPNETWRARYIAEVPNDNSEDLRKSDSPPADASII